MDCINPILLDNPDFGQPYDIYGTPKFSVPCGHCPSCIVNSANEWRTRLEIENECSISSYFITLTYDEPNVPIGSFPDSDGNPHVVPYVRKRDVQLFLKRIRKVIFDSDWRTDDEKKSSPLQIRYFFVSEYGPTTFRPHYHGIIFGIPRLHNDNFKNECKVTQLIQKEWNLGFVRVDPVTFGRIAYVTKYLSCVTDLPSYLPKPFRLMSRRPGIGSSYLYKKSVIDWHRENLACYYPDGKFKRRLPRYLKDKIFDDAMKIDIREQIQNSKTNESKNLEALARDCGYRNRYDYIISRNARQKRQFENKLKKSRKDL